MARTTLTLSSKNYSSWSLRGWLMAKLAGIDFDEVIVAPDDADARAEILLLSPSILVPCLTYEGVKVWDTLAIGEFLNEIAPDAGLLPKDRAKRAHCRSICGEMHSGFVSLRQALPMNIKAHFPELQDLVEGARPTSSASRRSGANACERMAGRSCSARLRSPTRCTRRSSAASAPTTSSWTPGLQAYADRIWDAAGDGRNGARRRWGKRRKSRNSRSSSDAARSPARRP